MRKLSRGLSRNRVLRILLIYTYLFIFDGIFTLAPANNGQRGRNTRVGESLRLVKKLLRVRRRVASLGIPTLGEPD